VRSTIKINKGTFIPELTTEFYEADLKFNGYSLSSFYGKLHWVRVELVNPIVIGNNIEDLAAFTVYLEEIIFLDKKDYDKFLKEIVVQGIIE
jgi:hypothetical protein